MEIINISGMEPNAPGVVYCGPPFRDGWREGALQHRYTEGKDSTREERIAKFGDRLRGIVSGTSPIHKLNFPILMALDALTPDSVLGCWCKPKACHCDVIPEVWKERNESLSSEAHRLKKIGFTLVGHWKHTGDLDNLLFAVFRYKGKCNALYAFVVNGKLMYIGQTKNGLVERLAGYSGKPKGKKSTNQQLHDEICDALAQVQKVEIYVLSDLKIHANICALPDNGLLSYQGFHVNLAAGLEDSLIRGLNPPWNGKEKREKKMARDSLI